jgi:hypothetical protein
MQLLGIWSRLSYTYKLSRIQFFFLYYCSYLQYDQKPVSIIDTLTMTLKFVCQQGLLRGEEREGGGGERAGKRPRTSLHPVPRFVSSQEMEAMEKGLKRWIKELTEDVDGKLHVQLANLCIHVPGNFHQEKVFTNFITCLLSLVKLLSHEIFVLC